MSLSGLRPSAPGTAVAVPRIHRPQLPPPPPLPLALALDETEWAMSPSRRVVAAGGVRLRVYNRGEEDHDLVIQERNGTVHREYLEPGESATITPNLAPGKYRIVCSLFAGTPESHEDRGIWTVIRVKKDPARAALKAKRVRAEPAPGSELRALRASRSPGTMGG